MPSLPAVQTEMLSRLSPDDRQALLEVGELRNYAKGEFIFRAGEAGNAVFLLLQGRIKIYQPSAAGKEAILWLCFAGELFGLAETARGEVRAVSAQASTDCETLRVRREQFMDFLESHPCTALTIVQVLSGRLRGLGDIVVNLIGSDVRTRILKMALQLGARCGVRGEDGLRLDIALTHQEIADMIGTTRQTVTTVLGQLEVEDLLKVRQHRMHLTNKLLARK